MKVNTVPLRTQFAIPPNLPAELLENWQSETVTGAAIVPATVIEIAPPEQPPPGQVLLRNTQFVKFPGTVAICTGEAPLMLSVNVQLTSENG